jgi:hypothetical protein
MEERGQRGSKPAPGPRYGAITQRDCISESSPCLKGVKDRVCPLGF